MSHDEQVEAANILDANQQQVDAQKQQQQEKQDDAQVQQQPADDVEQQQPEPEETKQAEPRQDKKWEWPLSEEHTQIGLVGLLSLVVFLAVVFIFRTTSGGKADVVTEEPVRNHTHPLPKPPVVAPPPPPKPQPIIVDFTPGQLRMVHGAQGAQSSSLLGSVVELLKKYYMYLGTVVFLFGSTISGAIVAFGFFYFLMLVLAIVLFFFALSAIPSGPEGDTGGDMFWYVMKKIGWILVILASLALALAALWLAATNSEWAKANAVISTFVSLVQTFFAELYKKGFRLLPIIG